VLVRRSSRSFSGWVAVPVVPAGSVPSFCAAFARSLGVSVFVRRGPAGVFRPPVPVASRPAVRRSVSVLRSLRAPLGVRWVVRPPAPALPSLPSGVRWAGVRSAWRVSVRGALRRRGFRLSAWSVRSASGARWSRWFGRRLARGVVVARIAPCARSVARSGRPLAGRVRGFVPVRGALPAPLLGWPSVRPARPVQPALF
jgi:hypothetical protein